MEDIEIEFEELSSKKVTIIKNPQLQVQFISLVMGSGKTTNTIKLFNENPDQKFIYVTPFSDEVTRIVAACKYFREPDENAGTKTMSFQRLVKNGSRIAITHSLFLGLPEADYSMFNDYVLVIDEVIAGAEVLPITSSDAKILLNESNKLINIKPNNTVEWIDEKYHGKFDDFRKDVESGRVVLVNKSAFVKEFPMYILQSFKEINILTYLAEASTFYFYFLCKGVYPKIVYKNPKAEATTISEYKSLITLHDYKNHNFQKDKPSLSKTYYDNATKADLDKIAKKSANFFRRISLSKEKCLFSTFEDYVEGLNKKSYIKANHIAHNARATNKFRKCEALSYLVNKFHNPYLLHYFRNHGIDFYNEDLWSISEMIQLVWRLQIRDGKPIHLHIPSRRMRNLMKDWLDGKYIDQSEFQKNVMTLKSNNSY